MTGTDSVESYYIRIRTKIAYLTAALVQKEG